MKLLHSIGLFLVVAQGACVQNRLRSGPSDDGGTPDAPVVLGSDGGTAPSRIDGETRDIFGGTAKNWVDLDAKGVVQAFSWTMPLATVSGVPDTTTADFVQQVAVPEELTKQTFIDGLDYAFLPKGHAPPGVYDIPHWEWHIFSGTPTNFAAIDCTNEDVPPQADLPDNYIYLPYPFAIVCAPRQGGVHVYDQTAPEFNKQRFTKAFALTVYAGSFASVEPKVTRDVLLARQSFTMTVPVMKTLHSKGTLYPTQLSAKYDHPTDTYTMTLSAFQNVE